MQTIIDIIQTRNGGIRSITIYVWTAVCLALRNALTSLKMPVKLCVRLHKTAGEFQIFMKETGGIYV